MSNIFSCKTFFMLSVQYHLLETNLHQSAVNIQTIVFFFLGKSYCYCILLPQELIDLTSIAGSSLKAEGQGTSGTWQVDQVRIQGIIVP